MNIEAIISEAMQDSDFAAVLKAKLEEVELQRNWPQNGDIIYYVSDQYISTLISWDDGCPICHKLREVGNIFANEEDAKHEAQCRYYRDKYRFMGRPYDREKENWYAVYEPNLSVIDFREAHGICTDVVYFDSAEENSKVIATIGIDNFIHYVLGIKFPSEIKKAD